MSFKIRDAKSSDIPQIWDINYHYVEETVLTFQTAAPSLQHTAAKFEYITQKRGLPFLVAVEEAEGDDADVVLGYAFLSPFRGHMLSYGPTVELSLFLSPLKTGQGYGSRLLAEILGRLRDDSPAGRVRHLAREFEGDEELETFAGTEKDGDPDGDERMRVRNVLAVMAVDKEGREAGEGLRRWYLERGFVEWGRLKGVGLKKGRW